MSLFTWSWLFLGAYVLIMIFIGIVGNKRVINADDFATARSSYGPLLLALAFASTAASGATFLGMPALTYTYGLSTLWIAFLYPLGIYIGILISQRTIAKFGNSSGVRSIPEYLGERYKSNFLRVSVALFSLILLFYLAGQLVAGLVMFEMMLGLPKSWALIITTLVLLAYITFGGAHADILTDGAQGLLMVFLAIIILVLFLLGVGSDGFSNLIVRLRNDDPQLVSSFYSDSPITSSVWSYISLVIAHIPLGLLPHIGNKLWALKDENSRNKFLILAFSFGMILPAITLGGALARGMFGDELLYTSLGANSALPRLFIDIFPTWLAALLGVGILSAVMSTADGLVISTSQVFANDIYRRTIAPIIHPNKSQDLLDRNVLIVSRVVTALTLVGASILAWFTIGMNVVLLTWIGIGGFTAALMGPLVLGCIWRGITSIGAIFGFWTGAIIFILIHTKLFTKVLYLGDWFEFYADSPYSAATISGFLAVIVTIAISLCTKKLPKSHLDKIF
ncbi:MAG: sodium:pantothenate symporter [Gammaproteobacteria bacterium TMED78]|nr:MAG: sodium:pantothenate symporter [Gammaproteobacteria bacterium TMED78]|tara:strand:- start:13565 stop:15091 length:1527 start_codon:yes stop_codon:yes gene_type:complete